MNTHTHSTRTFVFLLSSLTILAMATMDLFLPSLPAISNDLNSTPATIQLTVGLFIFVMGISQLFYGPLIDHFGRRPVLFSGLLLFSFATIGCIFAINASMLITMRILQAFGGCSSMILSYSISRDIEDDRERAKILSYVGMAISLSPIFAPIIGAFLQSTFGWRSSFVLMLIFGIGVFILAYFQLKESPHQTSKKKFSFISSYRQVISNDYYWAYTFCGIFCTSSLMTFIINSALLFMELLGLNPTEYALIFASNAGMLIAGNYLGLKLRQTLSIDTTIIIGACFIILSSIFLALTIIAASLNFMFYLLPILIMTMGVIIIMPGATAAALKPFKYNASTASALMNSLRITASGIVGSIIGFFIIEHTLSLAIIYFLLGVAILLALWWKVIKHGYQLNS